MSNTRRLSYPLTLSARLGADNAEGDVKHIVPDFPADPDQRVFVKLELSLNEYVQLATAVDVGRDIAYGDYSENIWWLWIRSLFAIELTDGGTRSPLPQALTMGTCVVYISDESEEDMGCNLRIEQNGNGFYLVEDCGCGVKRAFMLSPAAIDANGAISGGIDTLPTNTADFDATDVSECYYVAAAQLFEDRMLEYIDGVAGWLTGTTLTAAFGGAIEAIQWFQAVASGTVHVDIYSYGLSPSEVKAKFSDGDFRNAVAGVLESKGWNGQLTRQQIVAAAVGALPTSFIAPIPYSFFVDSWSRFVNLKDFNDELALYVADCGSTITLPSGFPGFAFEKMRYYDFSIDNGGFFGTDTGAAGTYDAGVGWWSVPTHEHEVIIRLEIDPTNVIDHVIFVVEPLAATEVRVYDDTLTEVAAVATLGENQIVVTLDTPVEGDRILLAYSYASDTGNLLKHITAVYISYSGVDLDGGVAWYGE